MSVAAGTRLGQYEVRELIGQGGMGEVYRAYDTKLKRDVAIKLLPEQFARDPERLARFKREAQLLASLNHPNIATIHGLEDANGSHFLVMELVPGETLQERVRREGAVPLEESLDIARQICEALEHAHEKPIIHRDLKPAIVKLTPEGKVKVLDFGLAKAFAGDGASSGKPVPVIDSNSPTLSRLPEGYREPDFSPTLPGVILGTAAYMSPEQARGKTVDKRTDIWALGCVLYELLTGKQIFTGENVTDILASVVKSDPDWTLLQADTPPGIRALLRRCLQKDANRRLRGAADITIALEDALSTPAGATPSLVARSKWKRRLVFSSVSLVGLAIAAFVGTKFSGPLPESVSRVMINLPPGQYLAALDQPAIAISPDGKNLVYVASQSRDSNEAVASPANEPPLAGARGSDTATQELYLRPLDSMESKPITGTDGAVAPFFSPDGQWIGFFAGGRLKKVSVNGGAAVTLASAAIPGGASWSSQGTLALQPSTSQGLQQVSQDGGTPQLLTRVGIGETLHRWPEFLPGGTALLFASSAANTSWNNTQIAVQSVGGGERKNLAQGGSQPRYASTGHLLYAQSGTLMAAPFDARGQALAGAAVPILEGVAQSVATGAAQYSVSRMGTLVYLAGALVGSQSRLVWVSRNGEEQSLPAPPHNYANPRVSPDGRRVAVQIVEQETHIWVYDLSRDILTKLTFAGNVNSLPAWSPDGRRIAFRSNSAGPSNLFWQSSDGSGGAERLTTSDYVHAPASFSPDGQLLAFSEQTPETRRDIRVLNLKDRKVQPFLKTHFEATTPKFSPDGKWLAYISDESGRWEVYVQPYPGPGGKWQISTDGGQEPVWNPKGGELFYRIGSKMMAVDVNQSRDSNGAVASGFSAGKPRMLFEGPYLLPLAIAPYYDVSPDGQRFLMLKPVESEASAPTQINVVLNWFEELKQKVPVGK